MKILLTGHCSSFFIIPWVTAIKKVDPNLDFYVLGLNNPATEIDAAEKELFLEIYEKESTYTEITGSKLPILKSYVQDKGIGYTLKKVLNFKTFKNDVIDHFWQKKKEKWAERILFDKDIVFIHYLNLKNLELIKYIKPEIKLVLCFWGSDLLQESSEETLLGLRLALKRADFVSVQNHGMRFICCTKYGWDLLPKIRVAPFIPNYKILNEINHSSKEEAKSKLGQLFKIPTNKIWLSCGYRSIPIVQQAEIIDALSKLPVSLKNNIVLILTMNYGNKDKEYTNRILQTAKKSKLEYIIIDRYLTDEELAALRKAMDIFIHFPMTDAMSATIIEHMYAGNLVITNSSLPYARFRKFNLSYSEVDEVDEVAKHVETGIMNQSFLKIDNRAKIHQMFEEDYNIKNWLEIIHDLKRV